MLFNVFFFDNQPPASRACFLLLLHREVTKGAGKGFLKLGNMYQPSLQCLRLGNWKTNKECFPANSGL